MQVCRHYGYNSELRSYKTSWESSYFKLMYTDAVSYLDPVSNEICRCCCCGAEFPIKSYYEMEHYVENNCCIVDEFVMGTPSRFGLTQRIEETGELPVKRTRYYYVAKDQIEYISD